MIGNLEAIIILLGLFVAGWIGWYQRNNELENKLNIKNLKEWSDFIERDV